MQANIGRVSPAHQAHNAAHEASSKWPLFASCKMPEFCEKSFLSGAEKHTDFQVTSCH